MGACHTCGYDLPDETRCCVETHSEYLNRGGRHAGRCWGGRFPTSADLAVPEVTEDEHAAARRRGRARYQQLALLGEEAA